MRRSIEAKVGPSTAGSFLSADPNALARTRYPDEIIGAGWDYGTSLAYQRELVAYWADEFDWREQERQINAFDHFKTMIDGLDIHFIHQRSPVEGATPLGR